VIDKRKVGNKSEREIGLVWKSGAQADEGQGTGVRTGLIKSRWSGQISRRQLKLNITRLLYGWLIRSP
jgi:hypothetical protein